MLGVKSLPVSEEDSTLFGKQRFYLIVDVLVAEFITLPVSLEVEHRVPASLEFVSSVRSPNCTWWYND